jgi:DGQHR domain-containing protein
MKKMAKKIDMDSQDALPNTGDRLRYSASLVTQGQHKFYTLTMPSEVLSACCFATNRLEDPMTGFQRVLDERRAQEIADYMDLGFGTIPSSVVLSAQSEADLKFVGGGKTIEFIFSSHSFLIIDGQHRVFGFAKAKTKLRIPVVIYNGLNKQQESKLFIDINTKQRPVPSELLLDIKKLADAESDEEATLGELFSAFNDDPASPLIGLLSPSSKASGKVSRVTFYAAVKPVLSTFSSPSISLIYPALRSFVSAFSNGLNGLGISESLINPTVFRAMFEIFPEAAQRVIDRHGTSFKEDDFNEVLSGMFNRIKPAKLKSPSRSHKELGADLSRSLRGGLVIG